MLDHQGHRGALVTVTVDPRDTVEVEVFAGSSHRDHDAVDPAHLAAVIAPAARGRDERAGTLRLFDALATPWGTRRRHRTTTLWFTVEPTSGLPTARGPALDPVGRPGDSAPPPSREPFQDDPADPLADLLIDVVTLSTSLVAVSGTERRDADAAQAATVARAARAAASRAALATERARAERDAAVGDAALTVAQTATLARGLARQQSDDAAASIAGAAAALAVEDMARASVADGDVEQAALDALLVASAVAEAAALRAQEAINAAVLVADAVTTAAAAAAAKAARAAEVEAETAASALDVVTQEAARQRADEDALAQIVFERHQRLTAVTLARLMRSNELLREQVSRIDAHAVR